MLYFSFLIVIIIMSILELTTKNNYTVIFKVLFLLITIVTIFRFGVGTDYFNYHYLFNQIPEFGSNFPIEVHGDIGYNFLVSIAKKIGISFDVWIASISLVTMVLFYITIRRRSEVPNFSLLIFYTTYLFTYVNSGIRQGLSLAIIFYATSFFKSKKLVFVILVLLATTIHSSAIIALILLFDKYIFNYKTLKIVNFISIIFFTLSLINLSIVKQLFDILNISNRVGEYGLSLGALLLRASLIIIILILLKQLKIANFIISNEMKKYLYIYFYSFLGYLMLSSYPLLAARITVYFKIFEILIIPYLFKSVCVNNRFNKIILSLCMIFLFSFTYYKEINGQINQGEYRQKRISQYNYMTIFQDKTKIYNIRRVKFNLY